MARCLCSHIAWPLKERWGAAVRSHSHVSKLPRSAGPDLVTFSAFNAATTFGRLYSALTSSCSAKALKYDIGHSSLLALNMSTIAREAMDDLSELGRIDDL